MRIRSTLSTLFGKSEEVLDAKAGIAYGNHCISCGEDTLSKRGHIASSHELRYISQVSVHALTIITVDLEALSSGPKLSAKMQLEFNTFTKNTALHAGSSTLRRAASAEKHVALSNVTNDSDVTVNWYGLRRDVTVHLTK